MYMLIGALLLIVCIFLILIVMVQNPKGGGLSSTFGGSNQIMGVQKTTDFLEKATWALAIALVVLSLGSQFVGNQTNDQPTISKELLDEAAIQQEGGVDADLLNDVIQDDNNAPATTPPTTEDAAE